MPTIICHPENWELVKRKINKGDFCKPGHYFEHFNIRTNEHMDKDKPTGKFRLPSGKVVERDMVSIRQRFVTYGPEDCESLVYAGIITEEREPLFVVMEDSPFRIRMDYSPMIADRRPFIITGVC